MSRTDGFLFGIALLLLGTAGWKFLTREPFDPFWGGERLVGPATEGLAPSRTPRGVIRMTVFSDYACQACRALDSLLATRHDIGDRFEVEYRHAPIIGGDVSRRAALLSICDSRSEYQRGVHAALFRGRESLSATVDSLEAAGVSELRNSSFSLRACADSPLADSLLNIDMELAASLGVRSTPVIVLENVLLRGFPHDFAQRLDAIRELR
jgi:protein-disulfide isomerase